MHSLPFTWVVMNQNFVFVVSSINQLKHERTTFLFYFTKTITIKTKQNKNRVHKNKKYGTIPMAYIWLP